MILANWAGQKLEHAESKCIIQKDRGLWSLLNIYREITQIVVLF